MKTIKLSAGYDIGKGRQLNKKIRERDSQREACYSHCPPWVTAHMPKAVPFEKQHQRLHVAGEPDFTQSPAKSLNK